MLTTVVSSCFVVAAFVVVVVFVSAPAELCVDVVASSCGCAVINERILKDFAAVVSASQQRRQNTQSLKGNCRRMSFSIISPLNFLRSDIYGYKRVV